MLGDALTFYTCRAGLPPVLVLFRDTLMPVSAPEHRRASSRRFAESMWKVETNGEIRH
jgi:hypothetical protein